MIIKFHPRGIGVGSGPVGYLLGHDRMREGARLDRGDPDTITALIDSSPYAKKYTSGVLSFSETDLSRETKEKLMSDFEKMLLPGLDADQYACMWVEHRDKDRLELNFVIPNIELTSGRRLQPYYDKADKPRVNAWKIVVNAEHQLHDPDDPMNRRALVTPRHLPLASQKAAQSITDSLLRLIEIGTIKNRNDVIKALTGVGFDVVRQTKNSISIANPEGGRNIRLKGAIYEEHFRFGEGLRGEIEAASQRYRKEAEIRICAAREVCARGIELKFGEHRKRFKRPTDALSRVDVVVHEMVNSAAVLPPYSADRVVMVAGEYHRGTDADYSIAGGAGRQTNNIDLRPEVMCTDRQYSTDLSGQLHDSKGALNDRIRATVTEISDRIERSVRAAANRINGNVQRFRNILQNYSGGKSSASEAGKRLERASEQIDYAIENVKFTMEIQNCNQSNEFNSFKKV